MCSKIQTTQYTKEYWDKLALCRRLLAEADRLVVGVGSGLSAAGGLNYTDPELVKKWFPEYYSMGFRSLVEIQSRFWWLGESKPEAYWGYWARHIYHIRYETPALQPYRDLYGLVKDKDYFVVSTNCDGQLEKAGFPKHRIFAPQGEYRYFQCAKPCTDDVYDNKRMIDTMLYNMPDPVNIRTGDVPTCPKCGRPLVPNLRCDGAFVERPHVQNIPDYAAFLEDSRAARTVFLELGVGYNTPGIIRFPFEQLVGYYPDSTLIRANLGDAGVPKEIEDRAVELEYDLAKVLEDMK